MQITNIPGWSGLLMQTNATIPTRWSVLGVPPPTPPPPDIYFICLVAHISSWSIVGWRSELCYKQAITGPEHREATQELGLQTLDRKWSGVSLSGEGLPRSGSYQR